MTRVAVISFPGNNCEVESLRAIERGGMEAVFARWNDRSALEDIDAYFIPGGFSYEDRGRAGMVSARDPLLEFIGKEAEAGKVVIGNCNGAQVLVESGLIPLGEGLQMSLARNAVNGDAVGFLNEWIWITPTCARDRCATSDWEGSMHMPIAHGEGRFTTKDNDLYEALKENDQLAFSYCDADGKVSNDSIFTPNGSEYAIAGICNQAGNVVALMPHPERTMLGNPYFASMKRWIEKGTGSKGREAWKVSGSKWSVSTREPKGIEIFIDTIITNNEERTVEQAAKIYVPKLKLKQLRYLSIKGNPDNALSTISIFNPNKEVAYIRKNGKFMEGSPLEGITLLRRDDPDTGAADLGDGAETGVCYVCSGVGESDLLKPEVLEIFANPHASTLELLQ